MHDMLIVLWAELALQGGRFDGAWRDLQVLTWRHVCAAAGQLEEEAARAQGDAAGELAEHKARLLQLGAQHSDALKVPYHMCKMSYLHDVRVVPAQTSGRDHSACTSLMPATSAQKQP
jgi:hypothetical protein